MVASLYHYGAFTGRDVAMTTHALMGYGAGLIGLVAIKVLAPGFYASQDIRTPVKIAVVVLVLTQLLNLVFVPMFAHAGLALAIGLGALINAAWLLIGLLRRGTYVPQPGWLKLGLQVLAASAALALFLGWAAQAVDWVALRSQPGLRLGLLAAVMAACAVIYLGLLAVLGLRPRALMGR
jgi:putative peptidoglycan lipid II flippase